VDGACVRVRRVRRGARSLARAPGLLPAVRVHARHGHICARQVAAARRPAVPGPRAALPLRDRGRRVPPGQARLLGQRVRLQHVVHQGDGARRAARRRLQPRSGHQRLVLRAG
jgi:hypothetical protein